MAGADAMVIALKSRTIPAADAVALARRGRLASRRRRSAPLFKYCSTFNSTDEGNIGPCRAAALLERLGAPFTIACPAFPAAGRSIYQGDLFVNGAPLNESGMRDHPLTPMRDRSAPRLATSDRRQGRPCRLCRR